MPLLKILGVQELVKLEASFDQCNAKTLWTDIFMHIPTLQYILLDSLTLDEFTEVLTWDSTGKVSFPALKTLVVRYPTGNQGLHDALRYRKQHSAQVQQLRLVGDDIRSEEWEDVVDDIQVLETIEAVFDPVQDDLSLDWFNSNH